MKLRIARTMIVAAAVLVFASAVYAQDLNVRAKVPFGFVLGDKLYPAGEYSLQTVTAANNLSVYIKSVYPKNELKPEPALTLTALQTAPAPAKHTELVFHRMGNTYFLYQVWVAGKEVGREFPRSDSETLMAKNGTKSETVLVAANIAH